MVREKRKVRKLLQKNPGNLLVSKKLKRLISKEKKPSEFAYRSYRPANFNQLQRCKHHYQLLFLQEKFLFYHLDPNGISIWIWYLNMTVRKKKVMMVTVVRN